MRVVLPVKLSRGDLLAVARIHLPKIDSQLAALIAARAQGSDSYLAAIEVIAKRARYLATKAGRAVGLDEIEAAINDCFARPAEPEPASSRRSEPQSKAADRQTRPLGKDTLEAPETIRRGSLEAATP